MRVIGYARVSTDEQASEGVSMAARDSRFVLVRGEEAVAANTVLCPVGQAPGQFDIKS